MQTSENLGRTARTGRAPRPRTRPAGQASTQGVIANVIDVATKDCTALSDSELAEMADMCASGASGFEVGLLSKEREEWVLVTHVRADGQLVGFAFSSLERIGGTPSLLVGVASFARRDDSLDALRAVMGDLYRRALLAFPDEDVLVGTRLADPAAFRAYSGLADVVPRPGHKASGEERAWGRRLAKRFGADGQLDDRAFVVRGDGGPCGLLDYASPPAALDDPGIDGAVGDGAVGDGSVGDGSGGGAGLGELFARLDGERRDALVAFGWAMAEDLASSSLPL